ncbi:tetratricopeptide repeat-containing sensor histidine kinase [Tenacibaculum sp. nBUS_03]|uniref:tetratricopeptide repeat-containing sensor histidine kinase n=1 Tax=Tenacibaculum sp. nBUS_03 TaxID=3395320 RepID=UPI003EBDFF4F
MENKEKLFYFIFLSIPFFIYSQSQLDLLKSNCDSICKKNNSFSSFCKAYAFYKDKEYDSCYVYSSKALLIEKNSKERRDVLNYIQGVSAIEKSLYKQALINILLITNEGSYQGLKESKLGLIYLSLKKFDKAIYHYLKWEEKNSNTKLSLKKNAYHNLGLCYIHKKKYSKAKEYFNKEFDYIKKNDTASIIRTKIELANVYYNQYLDDEAIPLFEEAYTLAKSFSDIELKQYTAKNMAVVEKNRKRYKESVDYYIEYGNWKDSIGNRDRIWELTERDKKLAVAQKQKEIAVQDEKLKRQKVQRDGLIIGSSGLLLFIGFLGLFYRKLKKKNKLITQQKEDLNVANKTKDYLFSVVSHDLRSPINTIRYQHEELKNHIDNKDLVAIKEATNAAIAVTNSTSHLLNNVLHWSLEQSNQLVFDQKEYALRPMVQHVLHDYTILVEAKSIRIESDLKNALVKADKESLKIVLRNLLDNAVKYMNGAGEIKVTTGVKSETEAFISIEDTGVGIPKDRLVKINALKDLSIDKIDRSEGVGLGLILCQTLIKKNNGTLTFDSEVGKGTKITILLPSIPV